MNYLCIDPHLINYMRLAVAVAIIKWKPARQSAQEYTEQLCIEFRQMQLKWKAEVEELRAKISLLQSQLQKETQPPAEVTQVYRGKHGIYWRMAKIQKAGYSEIIMNLGQQR